MSKDSIPLIAPLSTEEITLARESGEKLALFISKRREPIVQVHLKGEPTETVSIPDSIVRILLQGLSEMGKGNDIRLVATNAELTTQEAAEILNLSRQYVVRLLDERKIPSHKVGTHRRVRLEDVLVYKEKSDAKRLEALQALVAEAQELDLGY